MGSSLKSISKKYQAYKEIITSLGEERRLSRQFEKETGSSPFLAVREMKRLLNDQVPMNQLIML